MIADAAGKNPSSVRRQYYRIGANHNGPREMVEDVNSMSRLLPDLDVFAVKDILNTTYEKLQQQGDITNAVLEVRRENAVFNYKDCLPLLKKALYSVVNNNKKDAMIAIIKAMEIIESAV